MSLSIELKSEPKANYRQASSRPMIIDLPDGAESTSHTSRIVNVGVGSTEAWRDAARLNASLELRIIRDNEWVEETGRGQTAISVKVKHPEIEHTVRVQDFERWLEASPRSPAEMILKNRLRELLAKGR
jgi:hypothetical protein